MHKKKTYHFIGIGGIGMGALASLLFDQGHAVTGSDLSENKMTKHLKSKGAKIFIGHDAKNVSGADFIIYSSAVKESNAELIAAKANHIPILKRAFLLAELMRSQVGITVAGAHGKTTTTSMISHLLIKAGLGPTTAVGGMINGTSGNAMLGQGKYFVAEVDESDGSFLYFAPQYSVITNIDREHMDYYDTWDNILKAYQQFMNQTKEDGCIFVCGEDEHLLKLVKASQRRYLTYGFSPEHNIYAKNLTLGHLQASFECVVDGKDLGVFQLFIPGKHNILNAMACIAIGLQLSISPDVIKEALQEFRGVQRRFQIKGHYDDILVIDDYAHHPTEIKATLEAAGSVKKKRLIVIFQPHRFTRLQSLWDDFVHSFKVCDYLIVTDIYAASELPIEGITAQHLVWDIEKKMDKPVVYLPKERIVDHLLQVVKMEDLVMTLGAGDITKISEDFVDALRVSYMMKTSSPSKN